MNVLFEPQSVSIRLSAVAMAEQKNASFTPVTENSCTKNSHTADSRHGRFVKGGLAEKI
jgi:hypothetical protein